MVVRPGIVIIWLLMPSWLFAASDNELRKRASWEQPTVAQIRPRIEAWLNDAKADEALRQKVDAAWNAADPRFDALPLERLMAVMAAVDARANEIVVTCQSNPAPVPPRFAFLFDDQTPELLRFNLRLYFGSWLSQHGYFDEAVEHLDGLTANQVVDPASLFFHQAVANHRLLKKDECLHAIERLLENEARLPRRYVTVAKLMAADIQPLEADSLDEISRLMEDIRRRLNFGHAGKKVRQEEEDVVAKLDKMIKELEEQQQQQQQMANGQGQGDLRPNNPAQDSQNLGGRGQGDVDQKNIGSKSGWGNLPPKDRERALQNISKDLPAHYREIIEEYFRKLAREGDK